jgi:hypothetical protein
MGNTDWKKGVRELLVRCNCHVHIANISFFIDHDEDEQFGYISFGTLYDDGETNVFALDNLKDRFRACWTILRGKRNYFTEVILDDDEAKKVRDFFIDSVIEREAFVEKGEL